MEIIVYVAFGLVLGYFILQYFSFILLIGVIIVLFFLAFVFTLFASSKPVLCVAIGLGIIFLFGSIIGEKSEEEDNKERDAFLKNMRLSELMPSGVLHAKPNDSTLYDLDLFFKDHNF